MNFILKAQGLAEAAALKAPALVVLVDDNFQAGGDPISALIDRARSRGDFKAEAGSQLSSYASGHVGAERLVLLGVGDGSPQRVHKGLGAVVSLLKSAHFDSITFCFTFEPTGPALEAAVLAIRDALYQYTATKTAHSKFEPSQIEHVHICTPGIPGQSASPLLEDFERANAIGEGVELAREWANRPANHATPTLLAQVAQTMAKFARIQCQVMGPREIERLGMGAFLAVAQGSRQEPRFIVLQYRGASKNSAPVVLVGKGITFDSGGISLKPAPEMDEMKFDMSGAASVLGVFLSLAQLQPALNVVGLIPAAENLPGGRAVKPGDVVRSLSGQTIEILNTDAEGRLILCDALSYAQFFEPQSVIDIATLTGACTIALGAVRSGLFSPSDELAKRLTDAGARALDPCWRMPLDEEYAEGLKTAFADVANVAGRTAGAITAAKFLQRFANRYPWAHLDIAGTAWKGSATTKGATGRPVGLLVHYLLALAQQQAPAQSETAGKARAKVKRVAQPEDKLKGTRRASRAIDKAQRGTKGKSKKPKV